MNLFPKRLSFLRPGLRTILAFGLPFVLYLLTLAPTVYNLDSAELSAAAATGGLVRATGYPLYLTIGYFWSKLPLGDVGYRMNLFSAFAGALTILLADRLLRRWQVSGWAALGSLGLLATGTYFWGMSLIAEVYTLHTCLMMALILALISWSESPSLARMAVLGLVMGMGLSHHAAAVLLIPGSLWYIGCTAPRKAIAPRSLLAGVGGLALGLSFYLYLPLRYAAQPAFNYVGAYDANLVFHPVNLQTIDGLWWLVSGRVFAGQMLAYTGADLWRETLRFLVELSKAFFLVGLLPGMLGAIVLARQNWRAASMLALMFICTAAFYINYRVVDKTTMFLPVYLIWAIWLAVGFQALITWVSGANEPLRAVNNVKVLRVLLAGCVLLAAAWNWRLVDLSDDWSTRLRGESILEQVEPGALIFGWWNTVPVIQYLQLVEGQRPDVQVVSRFLIKEENMKYVILKNVPYRPVYIDSPTPDLVQYPGVTVEGKLYRIIRFR